MQPVAPVTAAQPQKPLPCHHDRFASRAGNRRVARGGMLPKLPALLAAVGVSAEPAQDA